MMMIDIMKATQQHRMLWSASFLHIQTLDLCSIFFIKCESEEVEWRSPLYKYMFMDIISIYDS